MSLSATSASDARRPDSPWSWCAWCARCARALDGGDDRRSCAGCGAVLVLRRAGSHGASGDAGEPDSSAAMYAAGRAARAGDLALLPDLCGIGRVAGPWLALGPWGAAVTAGARARNRDALVVTAGPPAPGSLPPDATVAWWRTGPGTLPARDGSLARLAAPTPVDAAVLPGADGGPDGWRTAMGEIARVLAPGGAAVVSARRRGAWRGRGTPAGGGAAAAPDELAAAAAEAGLHVVRMLGLSDADAPSARADVPPAGARVGRRHPAMAVVLERP